MNWRNLLDDAKHLGIRAIAGPGPAPHEIVPYRGYGTVTRVLVLARAIESKEIDPAREHDNLLVNLVNAYKRIHSAPLRGARVRVTIGGVEREVVADDAGFIHEWLDLAQPLPADVPWHPVQLKLVAPLLVHQPDVRATGRLRVPQPTSTYGVISDLDDTVIQSGVANLLHAARTIMLGNARTRLPFEGVAEFYRALERGGDGQRSNPIFYVSSSPWNMYDVIAEFLELRRIPDGPILLQDWDLGLSALAPSRLKAHKEPLIRDILDTYPSLPFILIGDTSQHDPEIYREIVRSYPGRILAVYIRDVSLNPARSAAVEALANDMLDAGSPLVLATDTTAAAKHAAQHGWIT